MERRFSNISETAKSTLRTAGGVIKAIASTKKGAVGLSLSAFFFSMATIGPIVAPIDLKYVNPSDFYLPPSLEHPLGTDYFGKDVLRLIILGSREVLSIGVLAALITLSIALIAGLSSGFIGGWVDAALTTAMDITLTIPAFPLLLVLVALFRGASGILFMAAILSVNAWAGLARAIRSRVLGIKEREFVEAAKCLGLGNLHLIFREILPNLMGYIVIILITGVTGAIYAEVALFTLGVAPYSQANWGVMLNMALMHAGAVTSARYANLLAPALFIALLQIGLVSLSSSLEQYINPRLREEE